ncbi:hypothetical protein L210DRAFT_952659 [Boletus edulis BED1]|uniref:Uncharacterized protein n=1 Tax=Boletus edulis BED1 TaxID=1328754 RepID=A0AAD4G7M3_BOLED|nr:hypothetical protein L210DRAFT_952659 [Boletus edulis BED1]
MHNYLQTYHLPTRDPLCLFLSCGFLSSLSSVIASTSSCLQSLVAFHSSPSSISAVYPRFSFSCNGKELARTQMASLTDPEPNPCPDSVEEGRIANDASREGT